MSTSYLDATIYSLSVIARQCIAIICFERFCIKYRIRHPAIARFIEHVWKITRVNPETWLAWERGFSKMPISGLGDPLPQFVLHVVPRELWKVFDELVGHVVETSACTWYGDDLPASGEQLLDVLRIMDEHEISPPDIAPFALHPSSSHSGWGPPLINDELEEWRGLV